ncbi:MAG TPA: NapC/NirT family cytochrome c [Bryobacteraceae bacterium]|nr:NapC/NirT family cytochrome c [Bryobacteraceae bacterium]
MARFLTYPTIAWFFLQTAGFAEEDARVKAFHTDPVDVWGQRFLIATICLGIAILLFNLFKNRGTTGGPASWALLAAGVALVPLMATGIGTLLVFERAEHVQFCESCHITMQSFVNDMRDPKSESLAAVHFKNKFIPDDQCYDCHTSYGMFGTVEAKMAGMEDVYKYFTRTWSNPISMREPYPNHDCLKCHAESALWLKHDEHIAARDDLFADKMKCLDCHGADHPAHPESVRKVVAAR